MDSDSNNDEFETTHFSYQVWNNERHVVGHRRRVLRSGVTSSVEERDTVFARDIAVMTAATHPKKKRVQHPSRSDSDADDQRKRDGDDSE